MHVRRMPWYRSAGSSMDTLRLVGAQLSGPFSQVLRKSAPAAADGYDALMTAMAPGFRSTAPVANGKAPHLVCV